MKVINRKDDSGRSEWEKLTSEQKSVFEEKARLINEGMKQRKIDQKLLRQLKKDVRFQLLIEKRFTPTKIPRRVKELMDDLGENHEWK